VKLNRFGAIFAVMFVGSLIMSGSLMVLIKAVLFIFGICMVISACTDGYKSSKKPEKGKSNLPPDLERKFARRAGK